MVVFGRRRRIVPGGASGLQIRVGQRDCLRWVRLPLSSANTLARMAVASTGVILTLRPKG
jgi:hypothetical protein